MAGQHFSDPRVFYDITADQKYASLDDLFNPGKKDPKYIERNHANQKKKKNENEDDENYDQQKKKVEDKSKIQTVELNVNLCCDSCVWQVKEALDDVEGVEKVDCDQTKKKVWVKGSVKQEVVLKKVRKIKKDAELVVKKKQN
ncbi:hypothetical protein KC19_2G067200 [Ceratodon purpureus]|uniref:HMA domain-containing protein n=1 Tax=Ceratodon purpureus TaxID=3225 RepID=A0A8T0ITL8_CERPU|nr:hypothetical protein KC19_2G067200 [Ceratodon purpureus]